MQHPSDGLMRLWNITCILSTCIKRGFFSAVLRDCYENPKKSNEVKLLLSRILNAAKGLRTDVSRAIA